MNWPCPCNGMYVYYVNASSFILSFPILHILVVNRPKIMKHLSYVADASYSFLTVLWQKSWMRLSVQKADIISTLMFRKSPYIFQVLAGGNKAHDKIG
jgi:hypothetical protein